MLRRRIFAAVATGLLTCAMVLAGVAPAKASGCSLDPFAPQCDVTITEPGSDGQNPDLSSDGEPGGFTAGPAVCAFDGVVVPCSTDQGVYSNNRSCVGYVKLADPQAAPPPGRSSGVGAWYTCSLYCPQNTAIERACYGITSWSDTIPAGIAQYTPAQAAAALARTFQLRGIDIGMAPANKVHDDDPAGTAPYRRTWVGIPVWLWVDQPAPLTYGPYTETATLGGVTVTATARVTSVTWTSGDGQSVTCAGGTPFNLATMKDQPAQDSPTCGFRYQKTSGDDEFTVTATSRWTVTWTGGGANGQIALRNTPSSTTIRVGELQSVNTNTVNPFERTR